VLLTQQRTATHFNSAEALLTKSTMADSPPRKRSGAPKQEDAKMKRASPKTTGAGQTGLRHFSMKVCRKVEQKQNTTYSEVADELVREIFAERAATDPNAKFDEKNIRRRVYDALNVLMAMVRRQSSYQHI
jgi:hypothetical protein